MRVEERFTNNFLKRRTFVQCLENQLHALVYLLIVCFLATSLSFRPVSAEEGMIKATVKKKKVESTQEQSSEEEPADHLF